MGNFDPVVLQTDQFEVAYQTHEAGEAHDIHYHKKTREYNVLIHGTMIINEQELNAGDIFIIEPYEVSEPTFITAVELIVVRYPGSIAGDKYVVRDDT
ncbi:MAG: hypothetical protein ACQ9ET_00575 [Nitrosomonadaceae bacterium]